MISISPDEREQAFEVLLPIAETTQDALARVQDVLDDEQRRTSPLRSEFHPSQRSALLGMSRHAYTVREWGAVLELGAASRISTDTQEAQNIYMWLLEERYVLRVKHDLDDVVDPGTATLFSLAPQEKPVVVFLTWDTAPEHKIRNVSFATLEEPRWTITLAELMDAAAPTIKAQPPRPQVVVRSRHAEESGTSTSTSLDDS